MSNKKEYQAQYYQERRDALLERTKQRWRENKEEIATRRSERRRKLRQEVINAYGGHCVCCGESQLEFLAVDHIYNDGKQDRQIHKQTYTLYLWLKKNDFPKDRYQLLCHNCNLAKANYGKCPHNDVVLRIVRAA